MKLTIKYIMTLLVVSLLGLGSCSDDYSQPPVILPEGGIGTGAWDKPMTAYQCRIGSINPEYKTPWVTGYIVGVVNTGVGNVLNARSAQFEGPFTTETNLLIALTPEETDWKKCATVQLPSNSVRDALNLTAHPDNKGKLVTIKGTSGEKYCGAYGLRDCSDYNWGDKGKEPVVLPPLDGPFLETFDATTDISAYEAQGWKNVMVRGGLSGWYVRDFDGNNYITCSAYKGTATGGPYENWLVTPAIDMSKIETKTLTFRTQASYKADNSTLEVFVMTGDNPKKSENTKLEAAIAVAPESGYSSWVESGTLDLSAYEGTIYIGWRYYSAAGGQNGSTTYCVDDVNVGAATEPTLPPTPPTPPTPSGDYVYEGLTSSAEGWTFDNVLLSEGLTYVWKWDEGYKNLKGTAFINKTPHASESIAISPAISLAGVTSATVEFEHAANYQRILREVCKFMVREKGAEAWTELTIPTWPEAGNWNFVSSGKIDISAFDGKEIELGFKYVSTAENADTWEIKNVKVGGNK